MARKKYKYHYSYKITNTKNGKYYIGIHSTHNLDGGYMGSGRRIRESIRKHGKEAHTKEILEYFEDRESLRKREIELVNEDLLNDPVCMNLQPGGGGGISGIEHLKKFTESGARAFSIKVNNDSDFKENLRKHLSELAKKNHRDGKYKYDTFSGRSHTEEAKLSVGLKNSLNQKGEKNSQFGTRWINDGQTDKKIKEIDLNEHLSKGWEFGRIKKQ